VVPANGVAQFDLLITPDPPQAGAQFDVQMSFGSAQNKQSLPLPKRSLVFMRGKIHSNE
jgi:hypothetical protein